MEYVENMVRIEDILIVVFLDYGFKIMKYLFNIMEGRVEKYDLFLFIIVLEKVVYILGFNKFWVLV